jgi:hypothetical protein
MDSPLKFAFAMLVVSLAISIGSTMVVLWKGSQFVTRIELAAKQFLSSFAQLQEIAKHADRLTTLEQKHAILADAVHVLGTRRKAKMFVVLVNHSKRTDITTAWLNQVAAALTKQLQLHFCPAYGLADWALSTDQGLPGPRLAIFDTSDQPGALGYHDLDPQDRPYGDAFAAGETLDDLSETISHEMCELIKDLDADQYRFRPSDNKGFADEACDAVQGTPYRIDGVLCANFVRPEWYDELSKGPYDHGGALTAPHTKTADGYLIVMVRGVVDTDPPMAKAHAKKTRSHSRTARRIARNASTTPAILAGADTVKMSADQIAALAEAK